MIELTYYQLTSPSFTGALRRLLRETDTTNSKLFGEVADLYAALGPETLNYKRELDKLMKKYSGDIEHDQKRAYLSELSQLLNKRFQVQANKIQVTELYLKERGISPAEVVSLMPILEVRNEVPKEDTGPVPAQ